MYILDVVIAFSGKLLLYVFLKGSYYLSLHSLQSACSGPIIYQAL